MPRESGSWPIGHKISYANIRHAFFQELNYVIQEKKLDTQIVNKRSDIDNIISDIKRQSLNYKQYYSVKCELVNENGRDILCHVNIKTKGDSITSPSYSVEIAEIISVDEIFNIFFELHTLKPYLDKSGILEHLNNCVVPDALINLLWKSCDTCNSFVKHLGLPFLLEIQVTIFEMEAPDGNFTDILMYLEANTNFVLLRPLNTKTMEEIAYELFTIFVDFGSPTYFTSDTHSDEIIVKVMNILKSMELPFKLPQYLSGTRCHKTDVFTSKVKSLLHEWMTEMKSTNWAIGVQVVQWMMNTKLNLDDFKYIRSKVIKGSIHSPYHAMFGLLPYVNLANITKKPQFEPIRSQTKDLFVCSQCHHAIYKLLKCRFCQRFCHFYCCNRYQEKVGKTYKIFNKCLSCANANTEVSSEEEVILGP